ncbi:MAG: hypothetical protein A2202_02050 [Bdellovibrionales bacterium RIFOXYA1_FULL_36_14]|nr:MAG: hypothetical protein A2202_02050 [Bdellovibrionales bacterium RIFOXYA1_FULL_36_14]
MKTKSFKEYLNLEFAKRCKKNPLYSLRAFARDIQISHSSLCQFFKGKRQMSKEMIEKVGLALSLSPDEINKFSKNAKGEIIYDTLKEDEYHLLSDWYYDAILELLSTKNFKSDFNWIARRLNITLAEVKLAVMRLQKLNLIYLDEEGKIFDKTSGFTTTASDNAYTDSAKKKKQKQLFNLAKDAIDKFDVRERSHSGVTFAVSMKKFDEARAMIKKFRRELSALLEGDQNDLDDVYHLAIALFPLTKNELNQNNSGESL